MSFQHLLVPIDGSAVSSHALDFALARAKAQHGRITLAFAVNRIQVEAAMATPYGYADPTPLLEALDAEATAVLQAGAARAARQSVEAQQIRLDGFPSRAIVEYARHVRVDAIVMGTHGRRGFDRFAVGSTAEDVIRTAAVPVFAVAPRAHVSGGTLEHVLVAIDGSPASDVALTVASQWAKAEHARVTLCCVAERPGAHSGELDRAVDLQAETDRRAQELLDQGLSILRAAGDAACSGLLRYGDAAAEIVAAAESCKADTIVMGTHGRAGLPRFILGSVAESVLRTSPVPVCTVRQPVGIRADSKQLAEVAT